MTGKRWDLLLVITAPPHYNDVITSALRLAQAVLNAGGKVRVWACGYATLLTQAALGDVKPENIREPGTVSPSAAGIVRRMLAAGDGRLDWIGCAACSDERGATGHIAEVRQRSALWFVPTIDTAARTIYIGGV